MENITVKIISPITEEDKALLFKSIVITDSTFNYVKDVMELHVYDMEGNLIKSLNIGPTQQDIQGEEIQYNV